MIPDAKYDESVVKPKGLLRCGHCGKQLVPKPAGNKHGKTNDCPLRNIPARAFEEFVLKLLAELGKHPEIVKATAESAKKDHLKAVKPFEAKLKKAVKELTDVSKEVARLIDLAKRPEMKDLSSEFMEEANNLGRRKSDLQIERQKLQMEIDYRRNLVTDEKIICEKLTDFTGLFGELAFTEQAELLSLILKEILVSRFEPEKDDHPCDEEAFVTQMRTSWYRVDLKLFSNSLSIRDILGKSQAVPKVRNRRASGGWGGIRTHGTVSGTHAFQACPFDHSGTHPVCSPVQSNRSKQSGVM